METATIPREDIRTELSHSQGIPMHGDQELILVVPPITQVDEENVVVRQILCAKRASDSEEYTTVAQVVTGMRAVTLEWDYGKVYKERDCPSVVGSVANDTVFEKTLKGRAFREHRLRRFQNKAAKTVLTHLGVSKEEAKQILGQSEKTSLLLAGLAK